MTETATMGTIISVHQDLPLAQYLEHPALSASDLATIERSPAHFLARKEQPNESTPAQLFGSALHKYVLEPDTFADTYVVGDYADRRIKAYKEWAEEVAADGKLELLAKDFAIVQAMRDAIMAHPLCKDLLTGGRAEQTIIWESPLGVQLKSRPDYLRGNVVLDLKTTLDARPEPFEKSGGKYFYHVQAYSQRLAGIIAGLLDPGAMHITIAVEKEAPYGIGVFAWGEDALAEGQKIYERNQRRYLECMSRQCFPCYPADGVVELGVPRWALSFDDDEEEVANV